MGGVGRGDVCRLVSLCRWCIVLLLPPSPSPPKDGAGTFFDHEVDYARRVLLGGGGGGGGGGGEGSGGGGGGDDELVVDAASADYVDGGDGAGLSLFAVVA